MTFLPFTRPSIDEVTIAGVADVLRSGWITTGPKCKEFEAALGALLSRDRPGAALLPPGAAGLVDHALQPLFGALAALGLLALLVGLSYPRSSLDPAPAPR